MESACVVIRDDQVVVAVHDQHRHGDFLEIGGKSGRPRDGGVGIGRGDKIRTCDPLHPMQVRYQAAPRPDRMRMIAEIRPRLLLNAALQAEGRLGGRSQRRRILISSSSSSRI